MFISKNKSEYSQVERIGHAIDFYDKTVAQAGVYFIQSQGGSAGQGHTFETYILGKKVDNKAKADFFNLEAKTVSVPTLTKRKNKQVRNFTQENGNEHGMIECFGSMAKEDSKLRYTESYNNRKNKTGRHILLNDTGIFLYRGNHLAAHYSRADLNTVMDEKIQDIAIVPTVNKIVDDVKHYSFGAPTIYLNINKDKFYDFILRGLCTVEFRVQQMSPTKIHSNGTCFKINTKFFDELYDVKIDASNIENYRKMHELMKAGFWNAP